MLLGYILDKHEIILKVSQHYNIRAIFVKGGGGQQTKACDRTFDGVPDSGCPPVPVGQLRPFLVQIMPKHQLNHAHKQDLRCSTCR